MSRHTEQDRKQINQDKIKVAIITGHHPFNVTAFQGIFRSMEGMDFFPQNMEEFINDTGNNLEKYDVLLFYCMHKDYPKDSAFLSEDKIKQNLQRLGKINQGIFILHHSLFAFPEWELWSDICGIKDRSVGGISFDRIKIDLVNPEHPITRNSSPWEIYDELYRMQDAGESCDILLKTAHPQSMGTIAWVKKYKGSRVFCYQSGHDLNVFTDPGFINIVERGILWLANKL